MLIFKEVVLIINVNKIVYLDVCFVATFYELKISPTRRMIEVERTQKKKWLNLQNSESTDIQGQIVYLKI